MIHHPVKVEGGKMSLPFREVFDAGVRDLPDGDYTLVLEPVKATRTLQQLKGLRGKWMAVILKELGYGAHDSDYIYQQIKIACGYYEKKVNPVTGEVEKIPMRTGGFTKEKFREFMEAFRRYVEDSDTGFGILLPDFDPAKAVI